MGGAVRWNGTAYLMNWNKMQLTTQNVNIAQLYYTYNAANAQIKGIESDLTIVPYEGLTLGGSFSYNHTELTSILGNSTLAADVVAVGSRLAQAPLFQSSVQVRYNWKWGENKLYAQISGQTSSNSYSSLNKSERQLQPAYGTLNLSGGITRKQWSLMLYINNVTDTRAMLYNNSHYSPRDSAGNTLTNVYDLVTTNRPRTFGLKLSYEM